MFTRAGHSLHLPVVAAPMPSAGLEALLDRADAVCLSGGPDLDPAGHGARRSCRVGPTEPQLDAFEIDLVRAADARQLPILAICRGMQVLNVARGGTLHQHLPEVVGESIGHRQRLPGHVPTHPVSVSPDSRLGGIVGSSCHVNSPGFRDRSPVAREGLTDRPEQASLFAACVAAARDRHRGDLALVRAA